MSAKPRIERAALEAFVMDGVDATTTRTIAARAAVSEGAIYRHWKSKDELAVGLFMGCHRRLSTLIQDNSDAVQGISAKAQALFPAYCAAADKACLLFSFHLLQLHHFLPNNQEEGRARVPLVEDIIKRAMLEMQL